MACVLTAKAAVERNLTGEADNLGFHRQRELLLEAIAMSKVLLVESAPTMRKILLRALHEAGFDMVVVAESGEEAYSSFGREEFVLVVAEWQLPKMTGAEMVRRIRQRNEYVPILIITAASGRDEVTRALNLGVTDYLTKPFVADTLSRKLLQLRQEFITEIRPPE